VEGEGEGEGGSAPDAGEPGEDAGVEDAQTPGEDVSVPAPCAQGPLDGPIPGCRPAPPPSTGDRYEDCVARINQLRAECQCLPPLARWQGGESCADEHSEYDVTGGPHAGFRARICDPSGSAQNECPGWGSVPQVISGCLQAMWDEGPGRPFSEHGHYLNMSNRSFSRVACGYHSTRDGRVWSVQNFQ